MTPTLNSVDAAESPWRRKGINCYTASMRILHLCTPRDWRGGEQQLAYLATGLKNLGIEQAIAAPEGSAVARFAEEEGISLYCLPKKLGTGLGSSKALRAIYAKFTPSIVHCHDARAHSLAFYAAKLWRARCPLVVSRRVDFPVKRSLLSKWKYRDPLTERYACVSQASYRVLTDVVDLHRCEIVRDGIDIAKFAKPPSGKLRAALGLDSETLLIGSVAALTQQKDPHTLLKAMEIFRDRYSGPFCVALLGEGKLRPALEEEVKRLGLTEQIHFMGQRSDIPELLPDLDIFLLTSETEGLGQCLMEAMAAKVPIVATRAGGIPETVVDGVTGLLAHVKDPKDIAEQLTKLAESPKLRQELVAAAWDSVQELSFQTMSQSTLDLYHSLPPRDQGKT